MKLVLTPEYKSHNTNGHANHTYTLTTTSKLWQSPAHLAFCSMQIKIMTRQLKRFDLPTGFGLVQDELQQCRMLSLTNFHKCHTILNRSLQIFLVKTESLKNAVVNMVFIRNKNIIITFYHQPN